MDRIILSGVPLEVRLGVGADERAAGQKVVVDVEIECDTRAAGHADDFRLAVDYAAVQEAVRAAAQARPYALVEAMAEAMAAAVLKHFAVQAVRIRLKKPGALKDRGVEWAGVEIVRRRHD